MTIKRLKQLSYAAKNAHWEAELALQIRALKLPPPVPEYRFSPNRKWRFDFAWPEKNIAVEIEGGTRNLGRHSRHGGFKKDCEKYNTAQARGWQVYRFTSECVRSGEAVNFIKEIINGENT